MNGARRWVAGIAGTATLIVTMRWVASFAFPTDRVPFDLFESGLAPRLWSVWGYTLLFVVVSLAFGQFVIRRVLKNTPDGVWALAFSTGAISFASTVALFAWAQHIGYPFFWLLPLGMLAVGAPAFRDALAETAERAKRAEAPTTIEIAAYLFGGACILLLLLQAVVPDNINYDSFWYHLRSSERNAIGGGFQRSPEGDILLTLPQASSWLYTWAFLAPLGPDDRVLLAMHLELAVFIATLSTLPALVRAIAPNQERRGSGAAWIALFFFPSVFVYDTGIMGGADHIVALWAATSVLTWLQARESSHSCAWLLFGFQLAGLGAKYSSMYLLVPMLPAVLIDAARRGPVPRKHALVGLAAAAGVVILLTTPYWLRNWLWYNNPLYPFGSTIFHSSPWHEDATAVSEFYAQSNVFTSATASSSFRIEATLRALLDYHSKTYGWSDMTGPQPVMGSAYFMSMMLIAFLPERKRLVLLALLINAGIAVWFNTHQHHMRYLTILTPLMAAGVAVSARSMWQLGWLPRAGVLTTAAFLLTAYADVPFRRTHRLHRQTSPIENAAEFIVKRGPVSARMQKWRDIGAALPPQAKPLIHAIEPHLGLPHLSVTDATGLQFGINYGRLGSVAAVWRQLRAIGVTHILWPAAVEQPDSIAGEALFSGLAFALPNRTSVHGIFIAELGETPPPEPGTHILFLSCTGQWKSGIYPVEVLAKPLPPDGFPWPELAPFEPVEPSEFQSALGDRRIGWVVADEACPGIVPVGFRQMIRQRPRTTYFAHWVRGT